MLELADKLNEIKIMSRPPVKPVELSKGDALVADVVAGKSPETARVAESARTAEAVARAPVGMQRGALSGDVADGLTGSPDSGVEQDQPKDGKLHGEFLRRAKDVPAEMAEADFKALTGKSPEGYAINDIRQNSRLLEKKAPDEKPADQVAGLKQETARRIRAYTTDSGKGWMRVDYSKLGADKKGLTHERYVGLGDILLDPDVREIWVDRGGKLVKAHRGIVSSGRFAGRVGFLDKNNQYVATHTGDRFRILSNDAMGVDPYIEELQKEDKVRGESKVKPAASVSVPASGPEKASQVPTSEGPATMRDGLSLEAVGGKGEKIAIGSREIEAAEVEARRPSEISGAVSGRPNFMKVLQYVALKTDVPMELILAVLKRESGLAFPGKVSDGGLAVGMGQYHPESWRTQQRNALFQRVVSAVVKEKPTEVGRGRNILADLAGVAVGLRTAAEKFGIILHYSTPFSEFEKIITAPDGISLKVAEWIRFAYHFPGHGSAYGAFMKAGSEAKMAKYRSSFPRARTDLQEHIPQYRGYTREALAANRALRVQEGGWNVA